MKAVAIARSWYN